MKSLATMFMVMAAKKPEHIFDAEVPIVMNMKATGHFLYLLA